jgi:hypothetical protein
MADDAKRHGAGCTCTRCEGFPRGHELSLKHGAYAMVALSPRAAEIAEELTALVPASSPIDAPIIRTLALTLARIERASAALEAADDAAGEGKQRLAEDLRAWLGLSRRLFADLGLNPTSRARLGFDVARTGATITGMWAAAERSGVPDEERTKAVYAALEEGGALSIHELARMAREDPVVIPLAPVVKATAIEIEPGEVSTTVDVPQLPAEQVDAVAEPEPVKPNKRRRRKRRGAALDADSLGEDLSARLGIPFQQARRNRDGGWS